jgi:hypothetical protein
MTATPTIKRVGELPCWTVTTTPRGRWLSDSFFDVPDEDHYAGQVTGARLARDLIRLIREARQDSERSLRLDAHLKWTVEEAAAVPLGSGRRGAAIGFLSTMHGVLLGGVLHTMSDAYADARLFEAERGRDWRAEQEKTMRAEFVHRMAVARARRRQCAALESPTQGATVSTSAGPTAIAEGEAA